MMDLPEWAKREENYRPDRDRDAFISRSLLRLLGVLQVLRAQAARGHHGHAPFCLFLLVSLLLFIATARTSAFLWLVLGGQLVLLCFLPGHVLRKNLLGAMTAGLLSCLLILPAFLLWGGGPYLLIPFKTLLCVIALNLLQEYFSWHEITGALRTFHLPSEAVFILDTTLRYLVLLGDQAGALLTALKLRSVGHNRRKQRAMAGIMGILMQRFPAHVARDGRSNALPRLYRRVCRFAARREFFLARPADPRHLVCFLHVFLSALGGIPLVIELDDVCCAFAHEPVLRHVSCQIRKGETVLLTGPNGSGKTTLLRLLNGLVFPELGHYRFEGTEITAARMREHRYAKWFHQRLGYVWQNPDAQLFCASVEEELAFGPLQMGLADDDVRERVEDAIACFSLAPLRKRPPYHLSGGEKNASLLPRSLR